MWQAFNFEQVISSVFSWVKWGSHWLIGLLWWLNDIICKKTPCEVWHIITSWRTLAAMTLSVICMGLLSIHIISHVALSCGGSAGWLPSSLFYQWEESKLRGVWWFHRVGVWEHQGFARCGGWGARLGGNSQTFIEGIRLYSPTRQDRPLIATIYVGQFSR